MEKTTDEYNSLIWDLEENAGVQHYMQTKEQFIKQHADKSIDELRQRLTTLENEMIDSATMAWSEVIHEHFESCKREFDIQPANTIYENFEFWFTKYTKLIPTAWRDGVIDEDEICYLLEKSGDYFGGFEREEDLVTAWLPYNAVLEKVG